MSTPLEILSFDGYVFADHDWYAGQPLETSRGQYGIQQNITPRSGNTSIISRGPISPRRITVDITLEPNSTLGLLEAIDELAGNLDPRNQNARLLVANRNGVTVQCMARIEVPNGFSGSGAANVVRVVFVSEQPEWTAETATTVSQSGSVSPFSAAVANAGQAVVHPVYRIGWSVQRSTFGAVVGQKYRKRFAITNEQDRTMPAFPWRLSLGDTAALVSGSKAQSDGDDIQIVIDGESVARELIGWNLADSFAWTVLPGMDSGESMFVDIVYGNSAATNPPEWIDPDPTKPVFDISHETGTSNALGSTTTLIKTGAGWDTDRWESGYVYIFSGANAGSKRAITTNSTDTITCAAFGSAIASGVSFMLVQSSNENWKYAIRQTDRETDFARGRWYVNSAKYTPTVVSFEAPGSWRHELVNDNRDSMGQKRFSMLTTGGADKDPFALLDAQRMWEGNDGNVYNAGTADGVSLTTHVPISEIRETYYFDNPNGMCKAWVGVRNSGAEDWAEIDSNDTANGIPSGNVLGVLVSSIYDNAYQIVQALLPVNDIEIDLTWRRDTGSLTSATTTTSTDSSKEWETDQYDNGSILMLSGVNAGIKRSITSGTGTVQTHAAFPTASADGDRYVVQNKRLKAEYRDEEGLNVTLDTSVLDYSYGTETEVYELSCTLWVGDGPSGDPAGQHRALIGYAAGSKRLFITADEQLVIDSDLRKIRIYDTVTEEYTVTLTDPMVIVQWHNGTEWVRSADWLPLGLGNQLVWLEETNMGTLELEVEYYAAYLGA